MSAWKRQRQYVNGKHVRNLDRELDRRHSRIDNDRADGKHQPERKGLEPKSFSINDMGACWSF